MHHICTGFLVFLPFLIRNYYVSGYLFYPQTAIDLFDVEWKIPMKNMRTDIGFMQAYAQGLVQEQGHYSEDLANVPLRQWLPVWWHHLEYYEERLIYAFIVGSVLFLVCALKRHGRNRPVSAPFLTLVCFFAWIDHYMMDCMVFVKHNLTAPHYISQIPFPEADLEEQYLTTPAGAQQSVWYSKDRENSGYPLCPATNGPLGELLMTGEEITDGLSIRR